MGAYVSEMRGWVKKPRVTGYGYTLFGGGEIEFHITRTGLWRTKMVLGSTPITLMGSATKKYKLRSKNQECRAERVVALIEKRYKNK